MAVEVMETIEAMKDLEAMQVEVMEEVVELADADKNSEENAKGNPDKNFEKISEGNPLGSGSEYLSVSGVAKLAGCSYGTVRRAIECGDLAAYRIGRKFFIERQAASEFSRRTLRRRSVDGYTIRDLMERLDLSYAFISRLIKSGELPGVRVGRRYVVTKEDFQKFMQQRIF